ncbi:MAG: phosphoribosylformylglycinamidine synthase subunit PurL [Candidatus Altiarchaeales archaeon]|nr:phosphoribosylformylglycinamidine synthase subunit PurL [Candidatus Altiarchaeales archaeon]
MYIKIVEGVFEVDLLSADEEQLAEISKTRSLGLSPYEMGKIRDYFKQLGRNPKDIELEAFAQSWSEHCCYKSSRNILKETVFNIKAPQNICVISEDAGVVDLNEDWAYVLALESHNHPSALDPYGGAATGVGGILRDVVCMGAQPIALFDPLFFGPLDYPEDKLPEGTKHPRFLFQGVVSGIADYGNRVGIPTTGGLVYFDESYVGNCLVNVGCLGVVRKDELIHSRVGGPGDVYILAGGKTGRDGIHGVTFASEELSQGSDDKCRPAVQLGFAIMKEPLIHACLEANKKKLLTGLKDFGGGGLSCVAAEMAHAGECGATIFLDKIPLKEEGVDPWEIWVSESQERMMLSVKPEKVDEVLALFDFWDVPAVVVGEIDGSNRIKATYNDEVILDLELDFLLAGVCYDREAEEPNISEKSPEFKMPDLVHICQEIISMTNISSRESVIRRYDHQVRGCTTLNSLVGKVNHQTHSDACILKPHEDSETGIAVSCDVNPGLCRENPYWGAASAVEEVVRNLVAVGARPHSLADCLNFGNPEKPKQLGVFKSACRGLFDTAKTFNLPFVSGNVSLYNESSLGPIAPTPTIMGVGLVDDVNKTISSDFKKKGNSIYLVGETKKELGGSIYHRMLKVTGGVTPRVDAKKTKKQVEKLLTAMQKGLISSCHDLSEGGLFVGLAEMCFGGNLGAEINLDILGDLRADFKLFSESNGRFLVEVASEAEKDFLKKAGDAKKIGRVIGNKSIYIQDQDKQIQLSLDDLWSKWFTALSGGENP